MLSSDLTSNQLQKTPPVFKICFVRFYFFVFYHLREQIMFLCFIFMSPLGDHFESILS